MQELILSGPPQTSPVYKGSLAEVLLAALRKHDPSKILQVDGETGESLSAGEMLSAVVRVAVSMRRLGLKSDDVVAFVSENKPNVFPAALGVVLANGVVAPIDPTMKVAELHHMFNLSEPKFVFCQKKLCSGIEQALKQLGNPAKIIIVDNDNDPKYHKYQQLLDVDVEVDKFTTESIQDQKTQLAFILGSSGTTGLPKCVGLTHYNVLFQLAGSDALPAEVTASRFLQLTQFFWVSGSMLTILLTVLGSTRVFVDRFEPELFASVIQKYQTQWTVMSPAELSSLMRHSALDKYDLSSMMVVATGGAPLSKHLAETVKARLGQDVQVTQGYGMTEIAGMTTTPAMDCVESVGKLAPGIHIKVIDLETGHSLGPNARGEFCFKTDAIMKGYVKNQQATEELIDKDGWLHTGDLGYYDNQGRLFIVDRIKEFIKFRTWQVPPVELEALIESLPGVKEVGVTGIPNDEDIYHPMALVVLKEGANITEQEIVKYVADNLSEHKQLRAGVGFVDSIPRTTVGKIKRKQLKEIGLRLYNK